MTDKDIQFFQSIAEQLLLYCADSRIENRETQKRVDLNRAVFKIYNPEVEKGKTENLKNHQFWTAKEMMEMPFLKDLKYRRTRDGIHQFRYRREGFNVSFNSKNFEIAKKKARDFISELKNKTKNDIKIKHLNSFSYVADIWFSTKKLHVDALTYRTYLSVYKNHIEQKFGNMSISKILPMHLQPFFDDLFSRLGKTCENAKYIMSNVFKYAVANRLCPTNPMDGVTVEKHCRTPGKNLTDEQLERFKLTMGNVADFGIAYLIILYTGIRGAELESLMFDWSAGTFTVKNAKLKKSQKRRPENLTRTVPIFPALYPLRERIEKENWRFERRKISNSLCKFWTENSVKDLRHTFSGKAREAGIENEIVNVWMGHLTPGNNVTANVYTHFSMDFQKKEALKLAPY